MIRFIADVRDRFTVEFICATLKDNREGGFITSRGRLQSKALGLSVRALHGGIPFLSMFRRFKPIITSLRHAENGADPST